jgi:hypothetical protein
LPTVLPTLLAAAEHSKLPFYIAGGVLVGWAVVLAYIGLRNPTFPGGAVGQRGVIAVSLVFALTTMGLAAYVSS